MAHPRLVMRIAKLWKPKSWWMEIILVGASPPQAMGWRSCLWHHVLNPPVLTAKPVSASDFLVTKNYAALRNSCTRNTNPFGMIGYEENSGGYGKETQTFFVGDAGSQGTELLGDGGALS